MWIPYLILGLSATDSVTTFPDWRLHPPVAVVAPQVPSGEGSAAPFEPTWIVVSEHPALHRDSLGTVDVTVHPLLTALMWPIDHAVRPLMGMAIKPIRAVVRYGEMTELVDRSQNFIHPTGRDAFFIYPTAVLDGTTGSKWGVSVVDRDFFCKDWRLQAGGALSVAADGYASISTQTPPFGPFSQRLRVSGSVSLNRENGLRIPDLKPTWDPGVLGATSERRIFTEASLSTPGPIAGSWWDAGYQRAYRKVGPPRRYDADFVNISEIAWFDQGNRGIRGTEVDHTISLGAGWSDQENPAAPTKGGRLNSRLWYTLANGGGDVAGFDLQGTRYFLLGSERYVYKREDLQPYLDLDPLQIIRMLDPSTLRQRLTQRKILALYFRMSRIWELESQEPASYFSYPGIGGDAPARAYGGRYLVGKSVIGGTVEYRWPIWRFIDGTSFAELAWAAPNWWQPSPGRVAPGIGGGLRVRMPRLFLFRLQAAMGLAGTQLIVTTDGEF